MRATRYRLQASRAHFIEQIPGKDPFSSRIQELHTKCNEHKRSSFIKEIDYFLKAPETVKQNTSTRFQYLNI